MNPTTPGLGGLADRAVRVVRAHRAADPEGFLHRHNTPEAWNRWARRARVARTIAAVFDLPVDAVFIADDQHRTYGARSGAVRGDLITVTDPSTGQAWRFILDFTTPGDGWLLLDRCPECQGEVPATRIACLADLGEYLDGGTWLADETRDDPGHQPHCPLAPPVISTSEDQR
jgi:hypothetical protein